MLCCVRFVVVEVECIESTGRVRVVKGEEGRFGERGRFIVGFRSIVECSALLNLRDDRKTCVVQLNSVMALVSDPL